MNVSPGNVQIYLRLVRIVPMMMIVGFNPANIRFAASSQDGAADCRVRQLAAVRQHQELRR
jgi:hypothetical protein